MKFINILALGKSFITAPSDFKQCEDWADQEMQRLKSGLDEKRAAAIGYLGEKWIMHPVHMQQKKDVQPNILGK